jgi:hypothetical protein
MTACASRGKRALWRSSQRETPGAPRRKRRKPARTKADSPAKITAATNIKGTPKGSGVGVNASPSAKTPQPPTRRPQRNSGERTAWRRKG